MQTTMLKFGTAFHPPTSMIKKPQTHYTIFPKINITNNMPFHIASCCKKDLPKNSILTNDNDKLQTHVSALEAIFSVAKRNDLILLEHNGIEIIEVVQHVVDHIKLWEFTLLCELGSENLTISGNTVLNLTLINEENKEKMWLIYTSVECKDGDEREMKGEIKDALNAHKELKRNPKFVGVDSMNPGRKIDVIGHVTCSKLKTPNFEHYMEVRKNVLSEIDVIRRKHGGT
ncbi:hypothetical protein MKW94_006583 [Papaver nudicaule]|uniref:Uncharacterized protein n=1 Tax=Papaver nudicaule TaxID=74823 RepID=A0AA41VC37_PAPNU|nr:hypothetical protein [Papaver nudicaule]